MNSSSTAQTVSGPVPAPDLGITLGVRALLGILPGADLAPENDCSMMTSFHEIVRVLEELRELGVGTVVDRGGMTLGRDLRLYEVLTRHIGIHIVGSTGMGQEQHVGSHFTHPTSMHLKPALPLQPEELTTLFEAEITQGMVVPRVRRAAPAGVIAVAAAADGITEFETKSYRAAARTAVRTGVSVAARTGPDPVGELAILASEGLDTGRVLLTDIDRPDISHETLLEVLTSGACVSFDNAGRESADGHLDDPRRAELLVELAAAGHAERIVLGSEGYGRNVALPDFPVAIRHILTDFVPTLRAAGADEDLINALLAGNPQRLLALDTATHRTGEEAK